MKKWNNIVRILAFLIDYIIIMLPIQFIMIGILAVPLNQAELLHKILFTVYGALFIQYFHGATLGKCLGKIKVVSYDEGDTSLLYAGMRELIKTLYFIPVIGWILGIISVIIMFLKDGRALHDYISGTKVISDVKKEGVA